MATTHDRISVHVVLDTNVIFSASADKLLGQNISEFILETNTRKDIAVIWHLPSISAEERRYQMEQEANTLLAPLEKTGRVLGKSLGIDAAMLAAGVDKLITSELKRHGLQLRKLDTKSVDWDGVITSSVRRIPPFSPGGKEKEKGFRDAVTLETFSQIAKELPAIQHECWVIFLTADTLLTDAAKKLIGNRTNADVLPNIEALKTFLNALVADIGQDTIGRILPKANALFFVPEQQRGLFIKEKIEEAIWARHRDKLIVVPDNTYSLGRCFRSAVGETAFLSKNNRRLSFATRIYFNTETYRIEYVPGIAPSNGVTLFTGGSNITGVANTSIGLTGVSATGLTGPIGNVTTNSGGYTTAHFTTPNLTNGTSLITAPTFAVSGNTNPFVNNANSLAAGTTLGSSPSRFSSGGLTPSFGGGLVGSPGSGMSANTIYMYNQLANVMPIYVYKFGSHTVQVVWSATLTLEEELADATIEAVDYLGVQWDT